MVNALPALRRVARAATALRDVTDLGHVSDLPDVALLPTQLPQTDDPASAVAERLGRVRQRAWDQIHSADGSVATLRDLATIAVAVHAHTAAFHTGPQGPPAAVVARGRRWQHLSRTLALFITPIPRDDIVRDDLAHLAELLPVLSPLHGPTHVTEPAPEARQAGAVLNGAVNLMREIADHGARAFARITQHRTIYLPARELTGQEVTDNPDLVTARLHGALAPVPEHRLNAVYRAYGELGTIVVPAPPSWHPTSALEGHLERVITPITREHRL